MMLRPPPASLPFSPRLMVGEIGLRDCALCGLHRYRQEGFFYCVGHQATLQVFKRRCHGFSYGQPDADRVFYVQRLFWFENRRADELPEDEAGMTLLVSRVLAEKSAAGAGGFELSRTTALVTSGAKSQFETKQAETDDLSTGGILL